MDFELEDGHCECETPDKEYSRYTCTCCWACKTCHKFGGCDNMIHREHFSFCRGANKQV